MRKTNTFNLSCVQSNPCHGHLWLRSRVHNYFRHTGNKRVNPMSIFRRAGLDTPILLRAALLAISMLWMTALPATSFADQASTTYLGSWAVRGITLNNNQCPDGSTDESGMKSCAVGAMAALNPPWSIPNGWGADGIPCTAENGGDILECVAGGFYTAAA